jgi:hypothetical protein
MNNALQTIQQTTVFMTVSHLQALGDDDASCGKHGPAAVDELVGPVLLNGLLVLAQAEGIVAVAASAEMTRENSGRNKVRMCVESCRAQCVVA